MAIADKPEGPYVKHPLNPITNSGHEIWVWPWKTGVAAMVDWAGPEKNTIQYAEDGINFEVVVTLEDIPLPEVHIFPIYLKIAVTVRVLSGAYAITGGPTVIIAFSDDQGYGDFSCYGNPILQTPGLDKLHDQGISFSNFHVAPVCTPSRGELMTGPDAMHNKACMVPAGRILMRRDIPTMAELFRDNGYETGIFGK